MPENNRDRIPGNTAEASDERRYGAKLIELEDFRRERHGLLSAQAIKGQINPPLPVTDPVTKDAGNVGQTEEVVEVKSLNAGHSALGNSFRTDRIKKRDLKKKAA